jgi:hypothetical protein
VEDESMDSSEVVGREYVMVEKQTVEVNALADGELPHLWICRIRS